MRIAFAILVALLVGLQTGPALADCKDQVREMRQDINDNKDDYTREARMEAKKHLAQAELTLVNPLECREHLREARRVLRDGKKD